MPISRNLLTRAGQYIYQPEGYRAFIPAPLPPDPPVEIAGELQVLLSEADRALGYLDGSIHTLPNPDLFVFMYVRKEAVLSSQIEGTQSSLQDLLEAEAKIFSPSQPKDVDEVINYVSAMNLGLELLDRSSVPVSIHVIRKIHERLLQGVRGSRLSPGQLRNTQNWIGNPGCNLHEAIFVPPPHHEVPKKLVELEQFFHNTQLPTLITIGIIHSHFETIHPFLDGNGRVGRLLISLLLADRRILQMPVLYLWHYLKNHRENYSTHLQTVRDRGVWE
ncbi:MAG: Fic family protein, partial [Candidatus Dadabacteria bacterium]|nr:Fic family protein [Candidatus Dadabacteria bacterium]